MKHRRNVLIGLVLTTAAAAVVLTNVSAPSHVDPIEPVTQSAPPAPEASQPCAYQWDYQDDPELSASFDAAVKALSAEAEGRAQLFGERCGADFLAMETDFYVRLPVPDLTQTDVFGNWVAQIMTSVLQFPRERLPGPKDGFVEFTFEKNTAERILLRVPIQQYREQAQGKTGTELFELFSTPP